MIRFSYYLCVLCLLTWSTIGRNLAQNTGELPPIETFTAEMDSHSGFFSYYYSPKNGHLYLEIERWEKEFLYINSLAAGIGSNDVGLDRGQLGDSRVVRFSRMGPKVLLIQGNYDYRAVSDNAEERKSVDEAFAQSVLGGFSVVATSQEKALIDMTDFLLQDAHQVAQQISQMDEGTYNLDPTRSALYLPMTKNFPRNTEFEALLTFNGKSTGPYLPTVVPSPEAISVRQHHSFVQLPDDEYEPRKDDPRSGFIAMQYQDYATPIGDPLVKRFIIRHRLAKKNPEAAISEAVEPIVYYVDRGAPEPIRSALIAGASWWNQAFEAAGYTNAFQVKVMPADADPMDVRYNLIQWVHRSTRGWSYGASVQDPRTGEIIKGHVSLGSLRVRQDYLIAQGLLKPYETGKPASPQMLEMALARLRQLSAHEVGHTIGLMHNFAASTNDRASVMDYPHPFIQMDDNGNIEMAESYAVGIGEWDKRAIMYGYQDFPDEVNEAEALWEIVQEGIDQGLGYMSDSDARPYGSAHPQAHLWDNGTDAVSELSRLLSVRKHALANFGEHHIPEGAPMATLEEVLVPLYFAHRYQVEAAVKLVGGMAYTYSLRGDGQIPTAMVPASEQTAALEGILASLEPETLAIPEHILALIPPRAPGYSRSRETLPLRTRFTADPLAAASGLAHFTFSLLLHRERAARLMEFHARDPRLPSLSDVLEQAVEHAWKPDTNPYHQAIRWEVRFALTDQLLKLAGDQQAGAQVNAQAWEQIIKLSVRLRGTNQSNPANARWMLNSIDQFQENPEKWKPAPAPKLPAGSPIGCGGRM